MYTVIKDDLTDGDVCVRCKTDLRTVKEIHVVEGKFYCCKECAIFEITDDIMRSAEEQAIEIYNDTCEIVTPVDIHLIKINVYGEYSETADITFIMQDTIDTSKDLCISTEVIGFYYGRPDEDNNELYKGNLKATFI